MSEVTSAGSRSVSIGTPAAAIIFLASILEPMASIAATGGPTQVSPAAITSRANPAFSDRKPYPGWIASAPAACAAAMTRSPRR